MSSGASCLIRWRVSTTAGRGTTPRTPGMWAPGPHLTHGASRGDQPAFIEHLGGGAGFFNVILLYPSAGVAIVVMGNATRYDIEVLARLALTHSE